MKIILDAMGGDNAPDANIKGAVNAINKVKAEVILVGKEDVIRSKVKEFYGKELEEISDRLKIKNATETIEMVDKPTDAIRHKKDSSMVVGFNMLKEDEGDVFISAGNSGALLTGATLIVAKLDRLSRNVAFTSKLLENDVEIVFCDFPEANKLVLHIISSIAEYEAGLISQRTKQSLRAKKARGVSLGKPENLLGKLDQAIENSNQTNRQKALDNPNNRRAISMLKILAKEDKSLSEMARILNTEGFVTAKGGQFKASQVSILLRRYDLR